jgi:hypothetical protein
VWRYLRISSLMTGFVAMGISASRADDLPSRPWPFTAAFMGSGRLCYGGLYIREKTISWLTPFSQCQRIPFEVIEQWGEGNERNIVFRLKHKPPNCKFGVIYLRHNPDPNFGILWEALGYAGEVTYRRGKQSNWLYQPWPSFSCPLYVQ